MAAASSGLKDSSGDMAYAREAAKIAPDFDVFPSTEAALIEARSGAFAGCISATANCNADLCASAPGARAIRSAHEKAVAIRSLFDGKPLVSGIKALLAHIHGDPALAAMKPPLAAALGRRPGRDSCRIRRRPGQKGRLSGRPFSFVDGTRFPPTITPAK